MTGVVPTRYSNNFDVLRLVAATMVIVHHTSTFSMLPTIGSHAPVLDFNFGFIGVATFFIVSGYLIMMSWDRRPDLLAFMWARVLRIFPGLIVVVLVTIAVIGPLLTTLGVGDYFTSRQALHYLYTIDLIHLDQHLPGVTFDYGYPVSINTPLWTLPVEFKMYIFIAILGVAGALRKRNLVVAVFVLALLGTVSPDGRVFAFLTQWGITPFVSGLLGVTNSYPLFFLAGSLLYLFRDRVKPNGRFAILAFTIWVLSHYTHYWLLVSIFCLPYIVLAIGNARTRYVNQVGRIGDLSYGLYIYAFPIQHVWMHYTTLTAKSGAALFPFVFATAAIAAFASWHLVEAPAMRLKDRFSPRDRVAPPAATG